MLIYKFETEQDAINAKQSCDSYYGYPKEGCVTSSWVDYSYYETDNIYYIVFNDTLTPILGEPIEYEILPAQPENLEPN
jgi:hypothetical protein